MESNYNYSYDTKTYYDNLDTNSANSNSNTSTNYDDDKDDNEYDDDDDENDNNNNNENNNKNRNHNRNSRPDVLCSVLNTVVDYIMVSPDPIFDSIEYENDNCKNHETICDDKNKKNNNKAQIQVPLIRIFGPVVRRQKQQQQQQQQHEQNSIYTPDSTGNAAVQDDDDDDDDSSENDNNNSTNRSILSPLSSSSTYPIQTACLYIHGVYPYIVARPVQCGPDGSMLLLSSMKVNCNYNNGNDTSSVTNAVPLHQKEYVNWDNVQSVQNIIPQLTIALEACIQQSIDESTTFNDNNKNNNNNNNSNKTKSVRKHNSIKVIHNVSIVTGRGFYTYCPGNIVPFIKIQYYNPKDRWRIKRCLEIGISIQHLDKYYYPNTYRYNSTQFFKINTISNNNNTKSSSKVVDSLSKFNDNSNDSDESSNNNNSTENESDESDDDDNYNTTLNNRKNGRTNINNDDPNEYDKDLIIFNCYEAHIPYTMQFFKDNNLAGMSYIHISSEKAIVQKVPTTTTTNPTPDIDDNNQFTQCLDNKHDKYNTTGTRTSTADTFVQFRYPLPMNIPRRTALLQQQESNRASTASHANNLDACFLKSNTPNTYYTSLSSTSNDDSNNHNTNNDSIKTVVECTKQMMKQTSCDIELDIMVQHIVNVYDVMTELPTNINTQQRQQIHWRAVPSLREIWMEERCRMAKLLPPQHNFLSQTSLIQTTSTSTSTPMTVDKEEEEEEQMKQRKQKPTPPFTLAVKTSQSDEPGAELAVRGMKRLVNVTMELQNEFRRSLQQIIQRHIRYIQFISTNIQQFQQQQKQVSKQRRRKQVHQSTVPVKRRHYTSFDEEQMTPVTPIYKTNDTNFTTTTGSPSKKNKFDTQTNSVQQQQKTMLSLQEMLTPTHDEALEALYGMNTAFNTNDHSHTLNMSQNQLLDDNWLNNATPQSFASRQPTHHNVNDDILVNNQSCSESFGYKYEVDADDNNSIVQQQSQECVIFSQQGNVKHRNKSRIRFQQLSQAYYPSSIHDNSQILLNSQNNFMLTQEISQSRHRRQQQSLKQLSQQEEFELSQRLERGDGIVQGGPFENIDDVIDSQTLIPYDDTDVDNDEEDEEYCSVNNYEVLDGYNSDETDTDINHDQTLSVTKFEQQLSMLATQADFAIDDSTIQLSQDNVVPKYNRLLQSVVPTLDTAKEGHVQNEQDKQDDYSDSSYALLNGHQSSQDVVALSSQRFSSTLLTNNIRIEDTSNENRNAEIPWQHSPNVERELLEHLPARKNLEKDKSFESHTIVPAGSHISTSHLVDSNRHHDVDWFPTFPNVGGVEVCLIESPPDRGTVQLWHTKNSQSVNGVTAPIRSLQNIDNTSSLTKQNEAGLNPMEKGSADDNNQLFVDDAQQRAASESDTMIKTSVETQPDRLLSESIEDKTQLSVNDQPLQGIGNQGGRLWVEGGGQLKAKTRQSPSNAAHYRDGDTVDDTNLPTPVTIMQIEVHIQCRTGRSGVNDSKIIAMTPDFDRDKIYAIVCVFAKDPGGGEALQFIENICLFVPVERELQNLTRSTSSHCERLANAVKCSMPKQILGTRTHLTVECLSTEHQLLLRFASIVRQRDPDMLVSWDTQGAGLGYIIERGVAIGKNMAGTSDVSLKEIDMARLLGRTPTARNDSDAASMAEDAASAALEEMIERRESADTTKGEGKRDDRWQGSGLGSEWDDRVGAGAAAASICGRLVFAAWKLIAEEIKHPNFSYLPAVVSSVLDKRIPFHDNLRLTQWFSNDCAKERWRVIHHRTKEAVACLQLFDVLDIIGRSGEAARLSGVEFSQSFPGIRGSQYKVEGVLLRALQSLNSNERGSRKGKQRKALTMTNLSTQGLTMDRKSQIDSPWKATRLANDEDDAAVNTLTGRGYFFFSPSFRDVNYQEALEVQALTLEPVSGHRLDPVVVCDFTALYPSLIIAYNLCYSTCAGRLEYHSTRGDMMQEGRTTGRIGPFSYSELRSATVAQQHIKSLTEVSNPNHDRAYVAPSGTIFVSEGVLKGVLPQVLDEMLSTRAMLKKASKFYKKHVSNLNPAILRQLEARQLALKYVANVTYGYTSATFSGRCAMPLLADTIVECARRTLTNAINLANKWGADPSGRWNGAKVIYGDTDSVFVELPGRTVQQAFDFGEEFCGAVTANNPPPVQLKLEKVYLGSMMQTKKKYCGMKYESRDQKRPDFEAKGIETIRRDQCALTQKVLTQALTTLYKTGIENVKSYLTRQWLLILGGHCPVSDFILTGRVRSRYRGGRIGPVQAVLAKRLAEADPGRVVRHKERQPYVIVASPGLKFTLKDNVLTPIELLEQWDTYTIHTTYYITRHLNAALQRCLSLDPYQMDVHAWFEQCPKPRGRIHFWPVTKLKASSTLMISTFFGSDRCSLCGQKAMADGRSRASICQECRSDPVQAGETAIRLLNQTQQDSIALAIRCSKCNLCYEDSSTFAPVIQSHTQTSGKASAIFGISTTRKSVTTSIAVPIANCTCIDCPTLFDRHSLREKELEAAAVCSALNLV